MSDVVRIVITSRPEILTKIAQDYGKHIVVYDGVSVDMPNDDLLVFTLDLSQWTYVKLDSFVHFVICLKKSEESKDCLIEVELTPRWQEYYESSVIEALVEYGIPSRII